MGSGVETFGHSGLQFIKSCNFPRKTLSSICGLHCGAVVAIVSKEALFEGNTIKNYQRSFKNNLKKKKKNSTNKNQI